MKTNFYDEVLKFQHLVDGRALALGDELIKALEAVQERIIARLAVVASAIKESWASEPLKRRKAILERQRLEVSSILAEIYRGTEPGLMLEASHEIMEATARFTATAGKAAFGLAVTMPTIDKAAVTLWADSTTVDGLLLNDWLAKLEKAAADRIVSVGRQAMIEGMGIDSMARLMKKEGIQGSVPGLRGLARTFSLSAANYARDTTFEAILGECGWRHVATLDGRTCLRCGVLDGKVYKPGESRPPLPLHWQCRCLYLPDVGQESRGERPAVKHSSRWVNHKDGSRSRKFTVEDAEKLPASTTYEAWLKRQLKEAPAFVRSVLGKGRFELFEAGKLSIDRMVVYNRIKRLSEIGA